MAQVEKNLDFWMPDGSITYTPGGLAWLSQWGSLRYATTAAFLAFVWSDDDSVEQLLKRKDIVLLPRNRLIMPWVTIPEREVMLWAW